MASKSKTDPARTRPLSIEFLRDLGVLEDFSPPTGRFDPNGTWTHLYRLWLVQRSLGGGSLRLRREPTAHGGVRLTVDLAIAEVSGYLRRTRTVLDCAADALCSPRSWTLESQSLGVDDRPTLGTSFSEAGTLGGGGLEVRFGERSRKEKVPEPVTSNWSLFDAVQRLDGENAGPLRFAMLEGMDLLKGDQRLSFREVKETELGGRKLRLRGYHQVGKGVLPWQYWVDEQGRLLFAFSGVRAFIYDPQAPLWMQEKLDRARQRANRKRQAK